MAKKLVLLNKSNEGFGLSEEAHILFLKMAKIPFFKVKKGFRTLLCKEPGNCSLLHRQADIQRDHPALLKVRDEIGIECMGDKFAGLVFEEVDENAIWSIREIDKVEYLTIRLIN